MKSPVILDRTTTVDGIVLASYYDYLKSKGKVLEFDKDHKTVDFIHKENDVFSGSIWYIDKNEDVIFDYMTIVKKPEYAKIFNFTKGKKKDDSAFKAFIKTDETFLVEKLHFYIKAKKEVVENLLKAKVHSIGKKQNIGFGEVSKVVVETIDEDKGYKIDETTPSKPLPCSQFDIKSTKIAQSRILPPYWLNEDLEPCYMPTTSLYEVSDKSYKNKDFKAVKDSYTHNCNFLYNQSKGIKDIEFRDIPMANINKFLALKKVSSEWVEDNTENRCCITNDIHSKGIFKNIKEPFIRLKKSFSDYGHFKNYNFISDVALWNIENIAQIGYSYVDSSSWVYLQGRLAVDGSRYKDFLVNPKMMKPPFSINLKDTQNAQHISFKGKVSVSNAYFIVQYGDAQLRIDNEMLQQAIADITEIVSKKEISKSHLCGIFDNSNSTHPVLKVKFDTDENSIIIDDFKKKYNVDIRLLLASVKLD